VRHILILISILLLSSPLFGQSKKSGLLFTWENGSSYVGEWKDGKKHGQGTYTSGKGEGEGDKYVGEFKDGKKHGQGILTSYLGFKFEGEWKKNKPWNGILYDKSGKRTSKYFNGVKKLPEFVFPLM